MNAGRIGIAMTPLENRRDVVFRTGERSEELGYDFFGTAEGWSYDATHLLAEVARRTSRIQVMAGVLSVWSRTPGTVAMTAATLHHMTKGRFVLGLGASTRGLTEGLHDTRFEEPAATLESFTSKVRALLAGERLPDPTQIGARPLGLGVEPAPVPIYLAAMSPRTMEITGRLADGWLPFFMSADAISPAIEQMTRSRPQDLGELDVMPTVFAVVSEDRAAARRVVAANMVLYMTVMGDIYPRLARDQGFETEVAAVHAANSSPSDGIVPPESEALLEAYAIYGTPAEVVGKLDRWFAAGATSVSLLVPPHTSEPLVNSTLEAFAPARRG